jgi:3-oxoacyl-[acyl-carrier protein] reductase
MQRTGSALRVAPLDLGLRDRVFVVTGAASGMGKATAEILASSGSKLALWDANFDGLREVERELEAEDGRVSIARVDVLDVDQIKRTAFESRERFGRIDSLIHYAGILDSHQLEDVTPEVWDRVVDINLRGTFFTVQALAAIMSDQKRGRIVLTASDSARAGSTVSGPAYAASKGGVIALTRTLAAYLGPRGISVNAVCPGLTFTGMSTTWSKELLDQVVARTPLRRLAEAEDIARVAILLGSDVTFHMTGEVVEVNGGSFFD